ncbi:hypothetical protein QN377_13000 [Pseudomonas sp. CCC4.1]|uniref:hypothetical protein n=1 Tax=Pseudomonas sp. CCC4.1 TaxID=3048610 RepID=UPI002AB3674B|nr:hypothetical protein [Pseudomonas sp. CCC4.1]MDY7569139.1 hypothetical protein [Pseudomonas sp. CCC4.1]MEB0144045.1 hypothetical protein [Pseudomonas sp. CCC4.1]
MRSQLAALPVGREQLDNAAALPFMAGYPQDAEDKSLRIDTCQLMGRGNSHGRLEPVQRCTAIKSRYLLLVVQAGPDTCILQHGHELTAGIVTANNARPQIPIDSRLVEDTDQPLKNRQLTARQISTQFLTQSPGSGGTGNLLGLILIPHKPIISDMHCIQVKCL